MDLNFKANSSKHVHVQGILAEILDFVMGKGLIPADGEIWRVRRRAIVPALHQKVSECSMALLWSIFILPLILLRFLLLILVSELTKREKREM